MHPSLPSSPPQKFVAHLLYHGVLRNLLHPFRGLHGVLLSDLRGSHGVFLSDLRGSHGVFLSVTVWVKHTNAFDRPLPGVVVPLSATTSRFNVSHIRGRVLRHQQGIRSCGVVPGSTVL